MALRKSRGCEISEWVKGRAGCFDVGICEWVIDGGSCMWLWSLGLVSRIGCAKGQLERPPLHQRGRWEKKGKKGKQKNLSSGALVMGGRKGIYLRLDVMKRTQVQD